MANIAQQDHLYLEDDGTVAGLHQETKETLKRTVAEGSVLDVVVKPLIKGKKKIFTKVLAFEKDVMNPEEITSKVLLLNESAKVHSIVLGAL